MTYYTLTCTNLHKQAIISASQMASGFKKLFNTLEDLVIDIPNAKTLLVEFVGMATASGYLSGTDAAEMEEMVTVLADKAVFGAYFELTCLFFLLFAVVFQETIWC